MKIFIVRHAQSFNNAEPDPLNWHSDPALTEIGEQQAALVARHLAEGSPDMLGKHGGYQVDHILTSPQIRAMQTAAAISAALGQMPAVWTLICEHQGTNYKTPQTSVGVPGMTRQEMQTRFPGFMLPEDVTENGWWNPQNNPESLKAVYKRGAQAAQTLIERAAQRKSTDVGERLLLVSHGTFGNGLIHGLLGLPVAAYRYGQHNTGITRIDLLENRLPVLRYTNRIEHLPPDLLT